MRKKTLDRHIVADPEICHGQPTFLGTRIRVSQVFKQVAEGMDWDTILWQWRGTVSREAIAEAVRRENGNAEWPGFARRVQRSTSGKAR